MHRQRRLCRAKALSERIQEVVRILDADPKTDWSKVDLEALRQHLIDMDEVTLRAEAAPKQIDGGLEICDYWKRAHADRNPTYDPGLCSNRKRTEWLDRESGHSAEWGTAYRHCD